MTSRPSSNPQGGLHRRRTVNLKTKRLQVDEVWGFVGAKAKNADPALKAAGQAGDAWLWVATDADTKLARVLINRGAADQGNFDVR